MKKYPAGGYREPVYALMRGLGFSMSNWSDKHWDSADGINVRIYGAGSMAQIYRKEETTNSMLAECELDKLSEQIDSIRFK